MTTIIKKKEKSIMLIRYLSLAPPNFSLPPPPRPLKPLFHKSVSVVHEKDMLCNRVGFSDREGV